ncbi:class I adenylate-forming enzyme family protein [Microbacterium aerolatum]|uniref:Long-chain-fatty-acid--CoA ligase n=1 Tax=Microbacterium aerolatum TaxID=153731 RepID=A0A511ACV0_9MICO|nr:AMP-binding protein [Microbacterium aerolatum]GEK85203.1 long-chain-fatty-acid--CoA ligase [Microbacterium aerolatum]GGB28737.1 long-chain-fatty-acid--CoA ligase [Microbacterium aerolatum]
MIAEVDGPHTVGRWLRDRAASHPGKIAIDDRGVALDYATLAARAERLAQRLKDAGYGPGQRIATVSGNSSDHVVAFFACAFLGIAFIPLSWRLTPTELAELIRRSAPELVLVEDEHVALAGAALRTLGDDAPAYVFLGVTGVETSVPPAAGAVASRAVHDDDPLLVIYTSGSEAAPKGVVLTHANCFWTNMALSQTMPMIQTDVVLAMLPQYHVAAWNVQPLLAWWSGATVVLERSFQPGRVLQLICERRVTTMMGVPTQYRMLMETPGWADADLSSLRHVLVGGATMPVDLVEAWAARGVALTQGYGLTEAGPNVLALPAAELAAHPGTVGRPYPSVDVCIVDVASGLPLAGAATGELWVRGPGTFAEYLDDPDATARARSQGWLRTGDLAHRDGDGIYRIVDRLKEIYVSGGENVAPAEVEQALGEHPLVRSVAVVGAPDRVWGERGVAFVVARDALSADELLAFARERLAAFKLPAHVVFLDELPRSTIEKVARARLRAMAAQLTAERETEDADGRVR